jgi:uncharacterized protein (TIGR02421 family)
MTGGTLLANVLGNVDKDEAKRLLDEVTLALGALQSDGNLLSGLGWPREIEERFFASGEEELPSPEYERADDVLNRENAELSAVVTSLEGDEPIHEWLRRVMTGAIDRNRLLLARGTAEFGRLSLEIYGGAHTKFFGLSATNLALAEHVLGRLVIHGWDEAKDREERVLSDVELAEELSRRTAKHRPRMELEVVVDDRCASKAIAGSSRVRVREGATFLAWEADGLFCHEVETHVFSARNGAAQAHAPFLKAGGPRTTPTQEGLAVFAELYNHALAAPRLERLALRVKTVGMAEDGASFIDVFRFLCERGYGKHDSFLDAARVFRGGMTRGGSAFTKDACYLAGLLHVYAFLAAFVRGGFRDEVELLLVGRIALEDILPMMQLRAMGLLSRPKHRPRWLERWNTLLPYFAFASFLEKEINLTEVSALYKDLVAVAASAQPPPQRD